MKDKQALREASEKARTARARLEALIDEDVVLFKDDDIKSDISVCNKFIVMANPDAMLALLDELEATAHSAAVDHEAACSLVEENETLKRRIAEQREYYEGVIADGSKRIAELESKNGNLRTIAHEQNELAGGNYIY